jgi:hypothetical protein
MNSWLYVGPAERIFNSTGKEILTPPVTSARGESQIVKARWWSGRDASCPFRFTVRASLDSQKAARRRESIPSALGWVVVVVFLLRQQWCALKDVYFILNKYAPQFVPSFMGTRWLTFQKKARRCFARRLCRSVRPQQRHLYLFPESYSIFPEHPSAPWWDPHWLWLIVVSYSPRSAESMVSDGLLFLLIEKGEKRTSALLSSPLVDKVFVKNWVMIGDVYCAWAH